MAQKKRQLKIVSENTVTSENQNVNGAVLNRGISNQDRSLAFIKDDLYKLHPRVKREYVDKAIKQYKVKEGIDGKTALEEFDKVLAAVIIDEMIKGWVS
jgi:hypothetical protein